MFILDLLLSFSYSFVLLLSSACSVLVAMCVSGRAGMGCFLDVSILALCFSSNSMHHVNLSSCILTYNNNLIPPPSRCQMESACVSIHEALKSVIDYQTHFRLREAQGRSRAEDLNTRVAFWSIGEAFILLVVSISQVVLLRSFFSDRKTTTTRVGS